MRSRAMLSIRFSLVVVVILVAMTTRADAKKLFASSNEYEDVMALGLWTAGQRLKTIAPESLSRAFENAVNFDEGEGVEGQSTNNTCFRDLRLVWDLIRNQTFWAMKMLDASSKIPSGLLEGNMIDLGQYDECANIRNTSENVEIHGRPCMYSIMLDGLPEAAKGLAPMLSICVPSSCEPQDIMLMFNRTIDNINEQIKQLNQTIGGTIQMGLGVKVSRVSCSNVDGALWDTEFTVCLTIFLVFVGFLIACTFCDLRLRQLITIDDEKTVNQKHGTLATFSKFSLIKNAAAILSTHVKQESLPAIHGIRFLSMAWVVLGHQYLMPLFGATVNLLRIADWVDSWSSLYVQTAPFAVDTFFTISGFLMTYLFLKQMPKQKNFNVPVYYLHRFLRLTPTVIVVVVFSIIFIPKIGTGPRWDDVSIVVEKNCRTNWWPTILYVQNFVRPKEMCLGHLWYLAVDMQLFWISPILLYPLYRMPKLGLAILGAFFVASIAVPAVIIAYNDYPVISFMRRPNMAMVMDAFKEVYIQPYCRASPWLAGIYLGYEVATKNRKLTKNIIYTGWALAFAAFAFCTFGIRYFVEPNYEYQNELETFFAVISKPLWGLGVCWVIFACVNDRSGPITKILNWKYFLPLSRLSYCVYLAHFVFQVTEAGSVKVPSYYSDYTVWHTYLANLIICFVIAFFFSLLIESPLLVLEKMILRRNRESHSESRKDLTRSSTEGSTQAVYRTTQ